MAPAKLQFMQRYFPFLNWPRPGRSTWLPELSAGVTVGLMVIPQGVAYAALAGMPLITGIYASMLPALVAVLWSASTRLSVGPTALTCLLVASSLTGMALPGSAEWINLAVWLALLSGLLQLLLGFIRFGWLLNVVSAPILMGFSQAAAVLILASQLPSMLGLAAGSALWAQTAFDAAAASYGIASLVLLLLAKRFVPRWPAVVLLVLGAAGISAWSGYEAAGGKVVGALASGLPALYVPAWPSWHLLSQLLVPTLVITLVSFLETASSAKVECQSREPTRQPTLGPRPRLDRPRLGQNMLGTVRGLSHELILLALGAQPVCRCANRLGNCGVGSGRAAHTFIFHTGAAPCAESGFSRHRSGCHIWLAQTLGLCESMESLAGRGAQQCHHHAGDIGSSTPFVLGRYCWFAAQLVPFFVPPLAPAHH